MNTNLADTDNIPPHVPKNLVRDYDIYYAPTAKDPWKELSSLQDNYPDIFWNISGDPLVTKNGTWVVTRKELIKQIDQDNEHFSTKGMTGYAPSVGESWDLIPLEIDPPEHVYYRVILNRELSPKAINPLEEQIRQRARKLVDNIAPLGGTEFVSSFSTIFPVSVFFELTGLPESEVPRFFKWVHTLTRSFETEPRRQAVLNIRRTMAEQAAQRRKHPTDDLISKIVHAQVDGRNLTEDEITGMLFLLFLGGQDTVTATLSNIFKYLAENPEARAQLRQMSEEQMRDAVEEFLRMFSVVVAKRNLIKDIEINGVTMKKGDWVTLIYALGSLDAQVTQCPMHADFERTPNPHIAFAYGSHRCAGSNLARLELRVALEEWLRQIPDFSIAPGTELLSHSGIYGWTKLPLQWEKD